MLLLSRAIILASLAYPLVVAAPTRLKPRDVPVNLLAQLNLFEQYTAAAYCPDSSDSEGTKVTCSAGNCQLVEAADTISIREFKDFPGTDTTGFVAVDSTNALIVISFRGTFSVTSAVIDAKIWYTESDLCSGCLVHTGFWETWLSAKDIILASVASAVTVNPDYSLVVTGHSLGGAISTLCAASLRNLGYEAALYTYGAPKVGDATTATYITNQPGGNFRVTHTNDIIPKAFDFFPFSLLQYRHFQPEYWISSANGVTVMSSDITVVDGITSTTGNAQAGGFSISAHLWYFNAVADCHPAGIEIKL